MRVQEAAHIEVVALAVALVGQIGLFVVFEAVDGAVVVHVDAVEEFRSVGVEAQEGLFVIGKAVRAVGVVVLVVVGDEVVVLVPTRKYHRVAGQESVAAPVGEAVLVVVVIDEFVEL